MFPQGPEEDSKPNTRRRQCHFAGCRGVVELRPLNIKGLIRRSVHTPLATEYRAKGNGEKCEPDAAIASLSRQVICKVSYRTGTAEPSDDWHAVIELTKGHAAIRSPSFPLSQWPGD